MTTGTFHINGPSMRYLVVLLSLALLPGCASVFSGYYGDLEVRNAPPDLTVQTTDGVQLPTRPWSEQVRQDSRSGDGVFYDIQVDSSRAVVRLRRSADHVLILRSGAVERRVAVHRKLNPWWFVLDLLCGVAPAFYDAHTGNWNYFSPIDFNEPAS
jgi:hypothetical protein